MEKIHSLLQIVIALGIFNVWIFRFNKPSIFRGGSSFNLKSEFQKYGLSEKFMYLVGSLKIICAIGLLMGLFFNDLIYPSALLLSILMIGAISMHFKIKDPLIKSFPATMMLIFCIIVLSSQI